MNYQKDAKEIVYLVKVKPNNTFFHFLSICKNCRGLHSPAWTQKEQSPPQSHSNPRVKGLLTLNSTQNTSATATLTDECDVTNLHKSKKREGDIKYVTLFFLKIVGPNNFPFSVIFPPGHLRYPKN